MAWLFKVSQPHSHPLYLGSAMIAIGLLLCPSSLYSVFLAWCFGVVALLLFIRAYLAPYILTRFSNHIRVRSVSLRSIRGFYFRENNRSWHIDRFAYTYNSSGDGGLKGLSFKVEGFKLEIEAVTIPPVIPPARHRRGFTLTDLSPSPVALYIWTILSTVFTALDPIVRPATRLVVTSVFRQLIRLIPRLTEAIRLEVDKAVVMVQSEPEVCIVAENVVLKGHVSFIQDRQDQHLAARNLFQRNQTLSARALATGAWKSRLVNSFRRTWSRTWDHTLGLTTGSMAFDLAVQGVECCGASPLTSTGREQLVHLLQPLVVEGAARFSPRNGRVEPGSLRTHVMAGAVHANVDPIQALLSVHFSRGGSSGVARSSSTAYSVFPPAIRSHHNASSTSSSHAGGRGDKRFSLPIELIKSISINSGSLTLLKMIGDHSYLLTVKDLSCSCEISDPATNLTHLTWLGKHSDSKAYGLSLALQRTSLQRSSHPPILSIGSTSIQSVVSDWPVITPLDPLLRGSTNALVLLDINITSVSLMGPLDVLLQLTERRSSEGEPLLDDAPFCPAFLSPVPQIVLNFTVGPLLAQLECTNLPDIAELISFELETTGMILNSSSTFCAGAPDIALHRYALTLEDALVMSMPFHLLLHPLSLRLRSDSAKSAQSHKSVADSEPVVSSPLFRLEAMDANGTLTGLGKSTDQDQPILAILDTRSLFVDFHLHSEAATVELWQPSRIKIVGALLSLVSAHSASSSTLHRDSPALQVGCSFTFSIAQAVVFITGTDLNAVGKNPRGVALSTRISLSICTVGTNHCYALAHVLSESHLRQMLCLPPSNLSNATLLARTSEISPGSVIFGRVVLWDMSVRSATAGLFSVDDPLVFQRDSPSLATNQILAIQSVNIDIKYTTQQHSHPKNATCDTLFVVDDFAFSFELSLVYSALLALQTIQTLLEKLSTSSPSPSRPYRSRSASVIIHGSVKAIRSHFNFSGQRMVTRINHAEVSFGSQGPHYSVDSLFAWVPIASPKGQRSNETWDELCCLHKASLSSAQLFASRIDVTTDSLRLRIPYGYVFSDLSQAAILTVKAVRHLAQMVATGQHTAMSSPAAEDAKHVPDVTFSCRTLHLEAADDPFESQLGFNHRVGLEAAKSRFRREEAFDAKAAAVLAGHSVTPDLQSTRTDYQFHSQHSVSIQEARWRLDMVHSMDWLLRHRQQSRERVAYEALVARQLDGPAPRKSQTEAPNLVCPAARQCAPPLIRVMLSGLHLHLSRPSFPLEQLSSFLHDLGGGLPHDTLYSLLVPMHITCTLKSLQVSLRDYPLPLLYIPPVPAGDSSDAFLFDSDLVIAEEMGPPSSIEWVPCSFNNCDGSSGDVSMLIYVPKTLMPLKTYARPCLQVLAQSPTACAWGVSYNPALQDVVRVLESLTSEARDPSPSIGFWDKLRLVFHWKIFVSFKEEARLYLKGSRDPYILENEGTGFALCWQGQPNIKIGFESETAELVQVTSEKMLILIPKFDSPDTTKYAPSRLVTGDGYSKICAKLTSGTQFGVGVAFERTCRSDCKTCTGSAFDRRCRHFTFRPHYDVQLLRGSDATSGHDSYRGFRSDFLHLSISLTSVLQDTPQSPHLSSSLYLTPKTFTNFWSWWRLFDDLSMAIRQGSLYPQKPVSPKLSRHLATIKYRISLPQLFITHVYVDDVKKSWEDGTTCFIGLKAKVDHLQADLHQRDQETIAPGKAPDSIQVVRHKPFYAAEVIMRSLDVRVLRATFSDTVDQEVPSSSDSGGEAKKSYHSRSEVPSLWLDNNDFVETDWLSQPNPDIHLFPLLCCPKLTYLKKHSQHVEIQAENTKFGDEDTHSCLLGHEPSVSQVEIRLAEARLAALQHMIQDPDSEALSERRSAIDRMITLLQEYIGRLQKADKQSETTMADLSNYYMPPDMISANEWADFENVYQIHAPNIFMSESVRDLLIQYYNCSKARRGYEYHMAARAVKFIRDQADALITHCVDENFEKSKSPVNAAQFAASALRRILTRERGSTSLAAQTDLALVPLDVDPLDGWDEGIVLRKSHFCLLLKPQIVLRTKEHREDLQCISTVVLAALQAKLQSFRIMDVSNLEDPVSGNIMTRNYISLDGLQTFCPTNTNSYASGDGSVPLEVLIDLRCETDAFDRIVPQTNATCRYDRFNRLRLRNNVASTNRSTKEQSHRGRNAHLYDETDLVQIHVPQFTVSANDQHFQFISDIITNLVLFSDVTHKARLEKLETLLFAYDFTDLKSAARVVSDLQNRLRNVIDTRNDVRHPRNELAPSSPNLLKLEAHIYLLAEELSLIFDAIRLAQNTQDGNADQKSALLLHASSSEISWRMLDEHRELLAKFAVRNIDFNWLSKQDSSTVSSLTITNLQAFDGSPHAVWTEIVSKFEESSSHPLFKRNLFLDASWIILAPVGGITIYEKFQVDLHPIRLQVDARLGRRIMEYIWPARRGRDQKQPEESWRQLVYDQALTEQSTTRPSFDSSSLLQKPRSSLDASGLTAPWKRLGASRSCTDLRSAAVETVKSAHHMYPLEMDSEISQAKTRVLLENRGDKDDAVEMKSRSSQKTFILVKISSLELLLSIMKAESFECRDARIHTHALEIRNQTWSFEELVDQFIPTDLTWKGWVRIAFHQPLVPVLPVARELFSKTKLIATKATVRDDPRSSASTSVTGHSRIKVTTDDAASEKLATESSSSITAPEELSAPNRTLNQPSTEELGTGGHDHDTNTTHTRKRLLSLFSRTKNTLRSPSHITNVAKDSEGYSNHDDESSSTGS